MADLTLDINEVQVLVHFPGDANGFFWHHRILLYRIEGGEWLTLTPDHDIVRHNLTNQRHRVLDRAAPFPGDIAVEIYAHDPLGRAALANFKRQAQIQAAILGEGALLDPEVFQWVVCEPHRPDFGMVVDAALLGNEATGLAFTLKGVILKDGEEVFVERVGVAAIGDWRRQRGLETADVRLLGDHRDASGKKVLDLKSAVSLMKAPADDDFPIAGTRAAKEFHESVASSTGNFLSYHTEWLRLSGVSKKHSAVHVHRALCEGLRLLHSFDQIDASAVAIGEHLTRWAIQVELAVERNPAQPDYTGLDIISGTAQLPDGRADTAKFSEWVTSRLKERASIWKQERLFMHERRQLRGKGRDGEEASSSDDGGGKGARRKKKKNKDKKDTTDAGAKGAGGMVIPSHCRGFLLRDLVTFNLCMEIPWTNVQNWIMKDLHRRISLYGDPPADLDEDSVMADLGHRSSLYEQEARHLAPMDLDRIKILKRRLEPTDAKTLAPPEVVAYLRHFDELVERTPSELAVLRECGTLVEPYWDPSLRRSRTKRLELYRALHSAGLLAFRRRRKARVGFFTVHKKGGAQRLIVDARQANACHRSPPTTRLATPAGMINLDLSAQTLEADGFGGTFGDPEISAEAGDVGDCFYNFQVPELTAWFATDDSFSREEIRQQLGFDIPEVYDDSLGYETPLEENERVYAVAQSSSRPGRLNDEEIRDRRPPPRLLPGHTVVGTYVDNVHTFGGQAGAAGSRMNAIAERFRSLGIPFEVDGVENQRWMDSLGLHLDFQGRCTARSKSQRAWQLWFATRGLLRRGRISGQLLRVYLGLANFHFQLMRPALSIFSACYRFASENIDRRRPVWPSVREELKLTLGLIFLVEYDMSAPFCEEVHIGDSSDKGYGLTVTSARHVELRRALLHREQWRFITSEEPDTRPIPQDGFEHGPLGFPGSAPNAGVGSQTAYGRELNQRIEEGYNNPLFKQRRSRLLGSPTPLMTSVVQGPSIPALAQEWDDPLRWHLVTAGPWQRPREHINVKEARVCLMGLRRLCRTARNCGTTALTLTDSMVACLAFEKGRSGSGALNALCRRAAAYSIGCRIQWTGIYTVCEFQLLSFVDFVAVSFGNFLYYFRDGPVIDLEHIVKPFPALLPGDLFGHGVAKGHQFDLLRPSSQKIVLDLIRDGRVWCVHFGTPCTVWTHEDTDGEFLLEARRYLRTHPVVFGNFTARDLANLVGYFGISGCESGHHVTAQSTKVRTTPEGAALPARLQLRTLKVTQKTLDSYHRHVQDFESWARSKGLRTNLNNLDKRVVRYMTQLALEDAVLPSTGAYLVFGLQMLKCTGPKASFLPEAKEALAGWRKLSPGGMRLPVPEEFVYDFAYLALDEQQLEIAFAMIIQLDTYLRPSECLGLRRAHIGFPAGDRYNKWSIVVAPFDLGTATKTGKYDDSVLVADKSDRAWLTEAMQLYMAKTTDELFPSLTLAKYEKWMKQAAPKLGYKSACVMPHILRHAGASNDAFHRRRPLAEIQKRGRWESRKSVTRYEKHALLLKRWEQADSKRGNTIRARSQTLPRRLLAVLRKR
ncbi:unnamed protein product [Symbiodinium sp. CCMP2456]|nr:unnamed protein product [Symbiodinium sp. CCMP2456]